MLCWSAKLNRRKINNNYMHAGGLNSYLIKNLKKQKQFKVDATAYATTHFWSQFKRKRKKVLAILPKK